MLLSLVVLCLNVAVFSLFVFGAMICGVRSPSKFTLWEPSDISLLSCAAHEDLLFIERASCFWIRCPQASMRCCMRNVLRFAQPERIEVVSTSCTIVYQMAAPRVAD